MEEEVPTRVTRGALRRRSIDQDATPQTATAGAGTTATGGTPKKANSTVKKGSTLGAIPEGQGGPSTPVGGVRISRRRASETIETPTTVPNRLVQNLKDSEAIAGSGPGRRSRNASPSLTEENVQQLDNANEGTGMTVRTRTPVRLRSSQETLTSTTPQTAPTVVRRSTRRNSVTSDDGSVQSLPITTPKTPVLRSIKAEIIVEEDSSGGDRFDSDSSPRNTRRQSGTPKASMRSPRRETPSPLLSLKQEVTPPRGSVSPKWHSATRKPPNSTPSSKNVSFADDSKQEDHQSGYPKTPTSPGRKFVLVGVNDLRHTQLINGSPKANALIDLTSSEEKVEQASKKKSAEEMPSKVSGVSEKAAENDKADPVNAEEDIEEEVSETVAHSPIPEKVNVSLSDSEKPLNTSSISNADRPIAAAPNDVSGIEALELSVVEDTINTSNDTANKSNSQRPQGDKFSKYWSHSVRGTTTQAIDAFSVRKQAENETGKEQEELNATQKAPPKTPEQKVSQNTEERDDKEEEHEDEEHEDEEHEDEEHEDEEHEDEEHEDEEHEDEEHEDEEHEEEEEDRTRRNALVDDEAMEVDGYQSGDSLDAETRQEIEENKVPDHGEDLGSEDTEDDEAGDDQEGEYENDSFIVSDDDELLDEDALLAGSGDDLNMSTGGSPVKMPKKKTPSRRRIMQMSDDSEEETEARSTSTSSSRKRSAKQLPTTDEEESSPGKKPNRSLTTPVKEEKLASTPEGKQATPSHKNGTSASKSPLKLDASVQSTTKSPVSAKTQSEPEPNIDRCKFLEVSQEIISEDDTTKDEEQSEATEKSISLASTSRKSLPAVVTGKGRPDSGVAVARKSLPAGTKMQFVEEVTTEDPHPSSSNLESSYNEEVEENEQLEKSVTEQRRLKDEEDYDGETAPANVATSEDEQFYEATGSFELQPPNEVSEQQQAPQAADSENAAEDDAEATNEASTSPVKPAQKSLPVASMISAQFYLGGSKKEKRNTLAGGEGVTMAATSTPNQKPSAKKNLVANPFALASAKAKGRLSMDAAAVALNDKSEKLAEKLKKQRNSLPALKLDENVTGSLKEGDTSVEEAPKTATPTQHLDEPEPMEVDEYVEEENEDERDDGNTEDEEKQPELVVDPKPKTPKKKVKALHEFDVESILTRVNEVVRADKERKKQYATLAQQKRDEKRRLREFREQQDKQQSTDDAKEAGGPAAGPNDTNSTVEESTGDDPTKKKKKRKQKVKNYVLEELTELKKDRVSEALLRKMEANEARKQRKKERRLEKVKLLNKENGTEHGSIASRGIGAKLQKAAKKKLQTMATAAAVDDGKLEQSAVRPAISAFAVFQLLQNNTANANQIADVPLNASKKEPKLTVMDTLPPANGVNKLPGKEESQQPAKRQEKEQSKKVVPDKGHLKEVHVDVKVEQKKVATKKKQKLTDEAQGTTVEKNSSEQTLPNVLVTKKTPTADDVFASKANPEGKINTKLAEAKKAASESQLDKQEPMGATEKNQRGKKKAEIVATNGAAEAEAAPKDEARKTKKQKKVKADIMSASIKNGQAVDEEELVLPELSLSKVKKIKKKAAMAPSTVDDPEVEGLAKDTKKKKKKNEETMVAGAIREVRATYDLAGEQGNKKGKESHKKKQEEVDGGDEEQLHAFHPAKKRKRDPLDGAATTPRPTKLRALQRADHGFVEETITPEKTRLKRNFGFEETQATPKSAGFKVSSLLPTDASGLLLLAKETAKTEHRKKSKKAFVEPNHALPLPVWTSSGYFIEIPDEKKREEQHHAKKSAECKSQKLKKETATTNGGGTGHIAVKGAHEGFKLKTLRGMSNGNGSSAASAVLSKPHRIDPNIIAPSVISFKRQQLLEKTAHLREKKKGGKV